MSTEAKPSCPYLDTINRQVLDFDFEKLCSVSLLKDNVYACLVCGKYFQGRGIGTHAFLHCLATDHHIFLNLESLKFYCLPENYEIKDSSLDDITHVLRPTFTNQEILDLDTSAKHCRAFDGTIYLAGIVGLNNIKHNDYCNVILQALSHVPAIRNYFLQEENYLTTIRNRPASDTGSMLMNRFGELIRKLWNTRNFKAHVSPHEMLQAVVLNSNNKFQITEQGDPIEFLPSFLRSLHLTLTKNKEKASSIISQTFRGSMIVHSRKIIPLEKSLDERLQLMLQEEYKEKSNEIKYWYLTLDLPPPPLFKDEMKENIIPQVPLYILFNKFSGTNEKEYKTSKELFMKRFELKELPEYLILCMDRFNNTFFNGRKIYRKNPTIVNFPITNIDLTEFVSSKAKSGGDKYVYDLIANIVHDGDPEPGKGSYRVHILHRGSDKWFEMQDLHVTEILPQMITLSESYIQIWERQRLTKRPHGDE
ncbi:ubiquitin specific protease 39 [Brevipalpus obovatus]|uniref:ubiquitin specific protease 39 n=1 Tax=Brevipalpus obovatus TaxID=246614 RepID=UPI003D9ECF7A